MNGHLGMANPFERPPLFGAGLHHPPAGSSPISNPLAGLTANGAAAAAAAAAIRDAQNMDFYSQRLKQLAGGSSSPGPDSRKRSNGTVGESPVPFSSPVSLIDRPDKRATPGSHSSTPRPGPVATPTDSIRSDSTKPSPNDKQLSSPAISESAPADLSGKVNGGSSDKHSSGSVDEDLLDDNLEEDEEDDDEEAEDLTTKSMSTTPTTTPVPSSSGGGPLVGSMIGDLMNKFGFSDIQEYQEAYRKALAESGAAKLSDRSNNNNNNINNINNNNIINNNSNNYRKGSKSNISINEALEDLFRAQQQIAK